MSHNFDRQTHCFVVRLWREPASETPHWRAQIEHVPSGEQVHFQISNALWEFVVQHLPAATTPPPPMTAPHDN